MKSSYERLSLWLIFVLLAAVLGVVGWNAQRLLDQFTSLEDRFVANDAQRLRNVIQEELNHLDTITRDYAAWDDTYNFMQTGDRGYIESNIIPASLENLQVNYILFLDTNGKVVNQYYYPAGASSVRPIPGPDLDVILTHIPYFLPQDIHNGKSGFLILPDGPSAFAAHAILTSAQKGPSQGTIIFGRLLDEVRMSQLSDDLFNRVRIVPTDYPEAQAILGDPTQSIMITELSDSEIAGTVRVDDVDHSDSFVVGFSHPRDIYASGKYAANIFLGVIIICGVITAVILFLLVKRLVWAMKREHSTDQYFSLLAKNSREIILFASQPDLKIIEANQAALRTFGYPREKMRECRITDLVEVPGNLISEKVLEKVGQENGVFETVLNRKEGAPLPVEISAEVLSDDHKDILTFFIRDISDRIERDRMIEGLNEICDSLRSTISIKESVPILLEQVQALFQADGVALVIKRQRLARFQIYMACGEWKNSTNFDLTPIMKLALSYFEEHSVIPTQTMRFFIESAGVKLPVPMFEVGAVRLVNENKLIGMLVVGRKNIFSHSDELLLESLADLISNTLHRVGLFEQTREYARQIEAVEAIGRSLAETLEISAIHPRLVESMLATFDGLESVSVWQGDQHNRQIDRVLGLHYDGALFPRLNADATIPPEILDGLHTQTIRLIEGRHGAFVEGEPDFRERDGFTLILPALRNESALAVLEIHSLDRECFTAEKIDLMGLVASSAANAYENALLYAEVEKRLSQLQALREIDSAIVSNLDESAVLNVVLEQVRKQLSVDSAVIWLPDQNNHHLVAAQSAGLPAGKDIPWQIERDYALEEQLVKNFQIKSYPHGKIKTDWMEECAYRQSFAAPMIAQGETLGSVEVFNHQKIAFDADWMRMFETLARQGAVALSTLNMFDRLQRRNRDLVEAYNATIEGWARALDMRDHETSGHSLRVADLTVGLARFMGVPEEELQHIYHGALLHDIGKVGIPDSVLLKAGSLDDKEWEIMRLHPELGGEFLKNIRFLEDAMDIPLCHHEWWNGQGYPRRLRGEEIPLAARIFAVVDVWDALNSDRPYRTAWPRETVLPYIHSQSGTHFDPKVVEMFTRYIQQQATGSTL